MAMQHNHDVIILGCGVIGLSTALRLQNEGMKVRIIAKELPPHTTSNIAPAMWHPYKVEPDERLRRWAHLSFAAFKQLAQQPHSGVSPATILEYYGSPALEPWYADAVDNFHRLEKSELPDGYCDGFSTESFVIDSKRYLSYLVEKFVAAGGMIEQRTVTSPEEFIFSQCLVVNCTGLGARDVAGDATVYPIRGQVVRVESAYKEHSTCVIDENGSRAVSYTVPRSGDVLLGGTAEADNWSTLPDEATTKDILRRAQEMVPELRDARILGAEVGLRPARPAIRVEVDAQYPWLIHNYGHSGAGFTLSWGCAEEVTAIVSQMLAVIA